MVKELAAEIHKMPGWKLIQAGLLLSQVIVAAAMALSSVSVTGNSLR
ncbi:hypothetical protein [Sinorhizobium arboris]|nr:hypothetical protein [Sinorhizobium arboris]